MKLLLSSDAASETSLITPAVVQVPWRRRCQVGLAPATVCHDVCTLQWFTLSYPYVFMQQSAVDDSSSFDTTRPALTHLIVIWQHPTPPHSLTPQPHPIPPHSLTTPHPTLQPHPAPPHSLAPSHSTSQPYPTPPYPTLPHPIHTLMLQERQ